MERIKEKNSSEFGQNIPNSKGSPQTSIMDKNSANIMTQHCEILQPREYKKFSRAFRERTKIRSHAKEHKPQWHQLSHQQHWKLEDNRTNAFKILRKIISI